MARSIYSGTGSRTRVRRGMSYFFCAMESCGILRRSISVQARIRWNPVESWNSQKPFRPGSDGILWNPEKVKKRSGQDHLESCGILKTSKTVQARLSLSAILGLRIYRYGKSLLLNGFFSPTQEMKARDHAVQKRHRNQESVEWLQIYCMIHSDIFDENHGFWWFSLYI